MSCQTKDFSTLRSSASTATEISAGGGGGLLMNSATLDVADE